MSKRDADRIGRPGESPGAPPAAGQRGMWLSDLSIRQPVFIAMLVLATLVVGAISYRRLPLELFPDVSLPVAVVQTGYPGVGPEEVERSVTRPIEDAVASINGVESVRSTSRDGLSLVVVEFAMGKDGKAAADDVRTRVNAIRNTLPSGILEPVVLRFDLSDAPVLSLSIADRSGQRSPEQMRSLADDVVKPRLEQVPGVAAVEIVGGSVREVHVDLDRAQLAAHVISPQQVVQAIRAENLAVPAGHVPDGPKEAPLRTDGEVRSLAQLGEIPVASRPNGVTIRLKNVASIAEDDAEPTALSRLDGQDSLVASVRKQSGTNSVRVADDVRRELDQLQREYPDLSFAVAFDGSEYTREAVQDVQLSLVIGALLAALVVLVFFRDLRNTLVTVAGLPVVLLGTFAALSALGLTLNMITLMALSLSVGMLIDDAIVVRENVFRHTERGEEPRVAASRGTAEIALAVVAVTSTIVAVFLPIAFAEGLAGQFLRDFGLTVAVAVVISLVEAFTLAPMLSAHFFRRVGTGAALAPARIQAKQAGAASLHSPEAGHAASGFAPERGASSLYRAVLAWSLRHRLAVVLLGLLALGGALALASRMTLSFAPQPDRGEFGIALELPAGARLSETDRVARAVEQVLRAAPEVAHVFTTVGSSDGATEQATLNVKLRERGRTDAFIARLRPELERAADGAKLTVDQQSNNALFGSGSAVGAVRGRPVQFSVRADDLATLDRVSADLVARLRQVPGLVDVDRSLKPGKPGRTVTIDRAKAADQGITAAQIGTTVRTLNNGEKVGTYQSNGRDLDVVVRLAPADRQRAEDVLDLPIATAKGTTVKLSDVASLTDSTEPSQIDRENRQRQVVVGGSYLGRSPGAVLADARAVVARMSLPPGVTIEVSGQAKSQDEMFGSLGLALGLSVLFVYMILASQFGSFVQPLTIMLALPFSAVGALLALYLRHFSLDMLGMIGIILLMGLVAKNSILLVEFIGQLRRQGLDARSAALAAGPIRLRPIVMTTLAMILGMVPTAIGLGAGAEFRQPMGVAVVGGLITSTLLTLVVVPVAYTLIDDLAGLVMRRRAAGPAPLPTSLVAWDDKAWPPRSLEHRPGSATTSSPQPSPSGTWGLAPSLPSRDALSDAEAGAQPTGLEEGGGYLTDAPVGRERTVGRGESGEAGSPEADGVGSGAGADLAPLENEGENEGDIEGEKAAENAGETAGAAAPARAPARPFGLRGVASVGAVLALASAALAYSAASSPALLALPALPTRAVAPALPTPAPSPVAAAEPSPRALDAGEEREQGVALAVIAPAPPSVAPAFPPPSQPGAGAPAGAAGSAGAGASRTASPAVSSGSQGGQPRLAVANTGGLGAYVRESPVTGAKGIIAWPEGTPLSRLDEAKESNGRVWVKVQDPKGNVGWVPKEYVAGGNR